MGDTVIADSAASRRAQVRLLEAQGSIRVAFESLGLGWTYDDVDRYLQASAVYQSLLDRVGAENAGALQGTAMAMAMVVAERKVDRFAILAVAAQLESEGHYFTANSLRDALTLES